MDTQPYPSWCFAGGKKLVVLLDFRWLYELTIYFRIHKSKTTSKNQKGWFWPRKTSRPYYTSRLPARAMPSFWTCWESLVFDLKSWRGSVISTPNANPICSIGWMRDAPAPSDRMLFCCECLPIKKTRGGILITWAHLWDRPFVFSNVRFWNTRATLTSKDFLILSFKSAMWAEIPAWSPNFGCQEDRWKAGDDSWPYPIKKWNET